MLIARAAFLFAGFMVAIVFTILYYMVVLAISMFVLHIRDETILKVEYWICLAAGAVSSYFLLRRSWPKDPSVR